MNRNYLDIITEEMLNKATEKTANDIRRTRRRCETIRTIVKHFDGAYVTKRLEQKIADLIPGATRVYISQSRYSDNIELSVMYEDSESYYDNDIIYICSKDNRRINGAALLEKALHDESDARRLECALERAESTVKQYNELAARYAVLYTDLTKLFSEIPTADYSLTRRYDFGDTPEQFLDSLTA